MASIPGVIIYNPNYNYISFESYDHSSLLTINGNGSMFLNGSVKKCAQALATFIFSNFTFTSGMDTWTLNDSIKIKLVNGAFSLQCLRKLEPDFFQELVIEFNDIANRMFKMKAFW